MAVYTHVDAPALSGFLSGYKVGKPLAFKGIAEGIENSNYFLQTEQGRFILTLYERRASAEDLPFFLDLMSHLARHGLPCPLPVKSKNGDYLQILAGKSACLITFLNGVSSDHPSPLHCGEVGDALAHMHIAGEDFNAGRENDLTLDGWRAIAADIGDRADEIETGLSGLIADELAYLEAKWPTDLPTGLIHGDLFPDNVLFTDDTLTGLIDFYFACTDFLAYDIAVMINAWGFDENHDFSSAHTKALIERYDGRRSLEPAEIAALPTLCRGAALRFLLTRSYDFLNQVDGAVVRVKEPKEYIKRLKFHQSVKDAADYVF